MNGTTLGKHCGLVGEGVCVRLQCQQRVVQRLHFVTVFTYSVFSADFVPCVCTFFRCLDTV